MGSLADGRPLCIGKKFHRILSLWAAEESPQKAPTAAGKKKAQVTPPWRHLRNKQKKLAAESWDQKAGRVAAARASVLCK